MEEKTMPTPAGAASGGGEGAGVPPEQPLFVNVTRMDRTLYFEAVRARARYPRVRLLTAGGVAVAAVGLLMHSYTAAALGAAVAVLTILQPFLIGRRDFRRLCAMHPGGEWTKTVRFYRERVEADSGGGHVSAAAYTGIRREAESEHMYILEYGRTRPAMTFDKRSFTKGSVEELRSFLTDARRAAYGIPGESIDEQASACERNNEKEKET